VLFKAGYIPNLTDHVSQRPGSTALLFNNSTHPMSWCGRIYRSCSRRSLEIFSFQLYLGVLDLSGLRGVMMLFSVAAKAILSDFQTNTSMRQGAALSLSACFVRFSIRWM
jgi:hypothetical protein